MKRGCRNRAVRLMIGMLTCPLVLSFSFLSSCSPRTARISEPNYWPTEGWQTASPESLGINGELLDDMFEAIDAGWHLIDGIVIVKDGYIVTEACREPFEPGRRHVLHSCTKSIVGAAVGIAIAQGYIPGVDTSLGELFPDADTSDWGDEKHAVNLGHMLTMSTGLKTRDSNRHRWEDMERMSRSPDWVAYALSLPMDTEPGERFAYSNITSFLLSAAIQQATGISTETFAREHLFGPLGITDIAWPSSPDGVTIGGIPR